MLVSDIDKELSALALAPVANRGAARPYSRGRRATGVATQNRQIMPPPA